MNEQLNDQRRTSKITIVVVIVVLVVIAAIAFPLWRSHGIASRVDTALKATDAAKVAVMESATVQGGLTHIKASELGYNPAAASNPYVAHIDIADGGRISLTTKNTGASPDIKLLLTPNQPDGNAGAPISWNCSILAGDADSVPANCRKTSAAANNLSQLPAASTSAPVPSTSSP